MLGGLTEGPKVATVSVPLSRSVYCAIQNREDVKIRIRCLFPASWGGTRYWEGEVGTLYTKKGPPRSMAVLNQIFGGPENRWMMRLIAAMLGLRRTRQLNTPKHGFDLLVWSRLPEGESFGHRTALTVALALAFKAATGLAKKRVDGVQVARAAVQGAQDILGEHISMTEALTSVLGRRDCALFIEHGFEPAMQWIPLPSQCSLAAVNLGSPVQVAAKDVAAAELAANMALALLNQELRKQKKSEYGSWGQVDPQDFDDSLKELIPSSQSGAEWIKNYKRRKGFEKISETVDGQHNYRLRAVAEHECRETSRAHRFIANVGDYARSMREGFLAEAGRCLTGSHRSLQDKCRVQLAEVDQFLEQVNQVGRDGGMFGGRLGASGRAPVAAVIVHQSARQPLRELVQRFCAEKGVQGSVITDTSDGGGLLGWWYGVLQPGVDYQEPVEEEHVPAIDPVVYTDDGSV